MNKRQIKKFCKKGGRYHFDKTIKRMSHKRLMHPYVTRTSLFNYMITWHEIGTCITCDHCTDVMVDWDGAPYACYSTTIGCGGCGKFECKRYKLDKDLKFFKFVPVHSDSPESDLKRYIDEQIKRLATDTTEEEKEERPFVVREELFDDESILEYLDQLYAGDASNGESDIVKAMITEIWSTRPDVDINDKSIHYFVMHSGKAGIFEVGKKYLIKVSDKTTCAICIMKNTSTEVTFLNAIVLEDEDPCMCYEFSKSDGDEFLSSGDLIIKEDKDE